MPGMSSAVWRDQLYRERGSELGLEKVSIDAMRGS